MTSVTVVTAPTNVASEKGPRVLTRAAPETTSVPSARTGGVADRVALQRATVEVRGAVEDAVAAAALAAERARAVAAMLDEVLAALTTADGPPGPCRATPNRALKQVAALSLREREVLALITEGRSNKAIAEALFISPNTVKTHVASLLAKLGADTRVQLAAMAAPLGRTSLADPWFRQ